MHLQSLVYEEDLKRHFPFLTWTTSIDLEKLDIPNLYFTTNMAQGQDLALGSVAG